MYIFTKFHKDWTIIVDFLLIAKFLAIPDNHESPYTIVFPWKLSSVYVFLKSTNFLNRYITDMWKHIISTYDKKRDFWNNFASMYLKKECMLRTIVGLIAKRRCKKWISIIIKSDVRESFFFHRVKIRAEISNNEMCQQCTNNMQSFVLKWDHFSIYAIAAT